MLKNSTAIFCGRSEIHFDINGSGFSISHGHCCSSILLEFFAPDSNFISTCRNISNSEPAIVLAQCGILIISYDNPGRHLRVYIAEHMNCTGLGG